jgi:hypothetical protein
MSQCSGFLLLSLENFADGIGLGSRVCPGQDSPPLLDDGLATTWFLTHFRTVRGGRFVKQLLLLFQTTDDSHLSDER